MLAFNKKDKSLSKNVKFVIKWYYDETADSSYLGELSLKQTPKSFPIVVSKRLYRTDYNYFVPMTSIQEHREHLVAHGNPLGVAHKQAQKYVLQDYDRMCGLIHGDWNLVGCAVTLIVLDTEIDERSLWGIEDDSESEYLEEIEQELMDEISAHMFETLAQKEHELAEAKKQLEMITQ